MNFFEGVRISWRNVKGHKLRSTLTTLGVIIGVTAVITFKQGPEMVSKIHPDPNFSMGKETELVALQDYDIELDNGLEDGSKWEIDITFEDNHTLFGIESKRGADFGDGQLEEELHVLEKNAGEKDPIFLAITEDRIPPSEVQDLEQVPWTSWFSVGKRIEEGFDNSLRKLITTMIDIEQFEGFPEPTDSQLMLEWQEQLPVEYGGREPRPGFKP